MNPSSAPASITYPVFSAPDCSAANSSVLNSRGLNSLGLAKPPAETRVVVAMSGGVDSSVVAALIKEQGYDVIGITMQLYDHGEAVHRKGACCAGQDIHDARLVAARLDIPHYVLDYEERFREKVIAPFAHSYATGETPIPCVSCNSDIKFADLYETALNLGAEVLATGHYVSTKCDENGERALYRALDAMRDQSYFLFATTKPQLELLRFPLGEMTKADVRALARRFGLIVADKAGQPGHLFRPKRQVQRTDRTSVSRRRHPGRHYPSRWPRARAARGRHPLHDWPETRPRARRNERRRTAVRDQARRCESARHRRPARGFGDASRAFACVKLDRPRRARRHSRGRPRHFRASPLDAPTGSGAPFRARL